MHKRESAFSTRACSLSKKPVMVVGDGAPLIVLLRVSLLARFRGARGHDAVYVGISIKVT